MEYSEFTTIDHHQYIKCLHLILASDDADRVFTIQPVPVSYTTSKRAAKLTCEAKDAFDIYIKCNSQYVSEDLITKSGSTINGQRIFKVSFDLPPDSQQFPTNISFSWPGTDHRPVPR